MQFSGVDVKRADLERLIEIGAAISNEVALQSPFRVAGHGIECSGIRALELYNLHKKYWKGKKK